YVRSTTSTALGLQTRENHIVAMAAVTATQPKLKSEQQQRDDLRGSQLCRFDCQLFSAFLRRERLTSHEVFRKNRLRTDQVVELILIHFPFTDVDGPLFELLRAGLDEGLGGGLAFVDQLFKLGLGVSHGRILDLV